MSWSLSVNAARDDFEEALADAVPSPEPDPGTDAANQVSIVKGIVSDLVSTGVVGSEQIVVSVSGHSTDGNAPHAGEDGATAQVPQVSINVHGRILTAAKETDGEPDAEVATEAAEPGAEPA